MLATTLMFWSAIVFVCSIVILLINMLLIMHEGLGGGSGNWIGFKFLIHWLFGVAAWLSGVVFIIALVIWCVKHVQ